MNSNITLPCGHPSAALRLVGYQQGMPGATECAWCADLRIAQEDLAKAVLFDGMVAERDRLRLLTDELRQALDVATNQRNGLERQRADWKAAQEQAVRETAGLREVNAELVAALKDLLLAVLGGADVLVLDVNSAGAVALRDRIRVVLAKAEGRASC